MLLFASKGDVEEIASILKKGGRGGVTVNFRDYDRRTAVHVASSEGNLATVKFLIGQGAKLNRSDRWGGSPLDGEGCFIGAKPMSREFGFLRLTSLNPSRFAYQMLFATVTKPSLHSFGRTEGKLERRTAR